MGQRHYTCAVTGDPGLNECLFRHNARGSLNLVAAEIKYQPAAVAGKLEKAHFCTVWGRRPVLAEGQCPLVWHGGRRAIRCPLPSRASARSNGQGCASSPSHRRGRKIVSNESSVAVGSCADPSDAGAVLAAVLARLCKGRLVLRA